MRLDSVALPTFRHGDRNPAMWTLILLSFVLLSIVPISFIMELSHDSSMTETLVGVVPIAWTCIALFLGLHQCFAAVTATRIHRLKSFPITDFACVPVAVLYTTMNDFREPAALSCLKQIFPQFHVFILDDSTVDQFKAEVDQFAALFPDRVTVIRRESRSGFKGGNLNAALRIIHETFPLFALADADTVLPADFLNLAISSFADPSVAFVQASIRSRAGNDKSAFASAMSSSDRLYWLTVVPSSAVGGFVMLHGHAAVVRTAAWQAIGGFPELVAEDLAFSTRVRTIGYRGVFRSDIVCEEDFPDGYTQFAARQTKYSRGALEHLVAEMPTFLLSTRVPFYEKLDRLSGSLILLYPCILVLSLLSWAAVRLFAPKWVAYSQELRALGLLTMILPMVSHTLVSWRTPRTLVANMADAFVGYLSTSARSAAQCFDFITTGATWFAPTHSRSSPHEPRARRWIITEGVMALLSLCIAVRCSDLASGVFFTATSAGICARLLGWNHVGTRVLRRLPIALALSALVFFGAGDTMMAGVLVTGSVATQSL
jgi:hypothetical protein